MSIICLFCLSIYLGTRPEPSPGELWIAHILQRPQVPTLYMFMTWLSDSIYVLAAVVAFCTSWSLSRRWWKALAYGALALASQLLVEVLKIVYHRQRPIYEGLLHMSHLSDYSYPSGHTLMATVLTGSLVVMWLDRHPHTRYKAAVIIAAIAYCFVIGWSRIYLGAHYPSDVLGAMCTGVLVLLVLAITF